MTKIALAAAVGLATVLASGGALAGKDLDAIKARGAVICGVPTGIAGFAVADSQGSGSASTSMSAVPFRPRSSANWRRSNTCR